MESILRLLDEFKEKYEEVCTEIVKLKSNPNISPLIMNRIQERKEKILFALNCAQTETLLIYST
jgi:hypothetical protein